MSFARKNARIVSDVEGSDDEKVIDVQNRLAVNVGRAVAKARNQNMPSQP